MDKLLEMLGVQKLDEKDQEAIKEKVETLIEIKAKDMLDEALKEEKDKLVEAYEQKFDEYKEDITGKFSNFVDEILENELTIPDQILEYARKGELYADLIEQFKVRLGVDEGLLDEEIKGLLREAKDEITNLREDLDKTIAENLEVKSDAQKLAAEVYLRRKTDGLTEGQKEHVHSVLEGITDREEIDRKFDIIVEAYKEDDDDDDDDDDKKKKKKKKDDDEEEMEEGKGKVDNPDESLNEEEEDNSPFNSHLNSYVKVLKENKI